MPELSSTRTSNESAKPGMRQAPSHRAAPANSRIGCGRRWSNTRAPVQVSAKAVNSKRVGEIDRDQIGHRSVQAEQHHRGGAQQMREAPPRHGA